MGSFLVDISPTFPASKRQKKKKVKQIKQKKFLEAMKAEAGRSAGHPLSQDEILEVETKAKDNWGKMGRLQRETWIQSNRQSTKSPTKKKTPTIEEEFNNRSYKTGLNRKTAMEEFHDTLFWQGMNKETGDANKLTDGAWSMIVLSPNNDGNKIANELVAMIVENGKIAGEMLMKTADAPDQKQHHKIDCYRWRPDNPKKVNNACNRLYDFYKNCKNKYILVPSQHQANVTEILTLMKETRDRLHERDTNSIRFDRLICIEDAVPAILKLMKQKEDLDVQKKWYQLTTKSSRMSTIEYAHAVADFFIRSIRLVQEEEAAGDNYVRGSSGLWITVTANGRVLFSDPTIKEEPRFDEEGFCTNVPPGRFFGPPEIC